MSSGGEDSDSSQPADGSAVFPAPSAQQDLSGALDWSGALGSGWLAQPSLQEQAPSMQNDSTTQEHLVGAPRMQTDSLQEGTSVQEEQEDPPPQPKARRGGSKRGRPPKGKGKAPFVWTEDRIEHLLKIRFRALQDRCDNAKSNQQVKECWDLLTAAVGTKIGENFDSEQCKNKLKHMKRLWDAYNNDLQQTGNAGPLDDPPCLGLMRDLWADKDGFSSEPFISSCPSSTSAARPASTDDGATTVNRVSEVGTDTPPRISSPNSSPSIGVPSSITSTMRVSVGTTTTSPAPPKTAHASRQSTKNTKQPRKKAKTQGEHVLKGMELLSSSIAKVASSISHTNDKNPRDYASASTRVMEKLIEQQHQQTQISTQLLQQQQLQSEAIQQMLAQLAKISDKLSSNQ